MTDSGKNRIKRERRALGRFYGTADAPKVTVGIDGLSHGQVSHIMFGCALAKLRILFRFWLFMLLRPLPFPAAKNFFYRCTGMRIGKNVYISPGVYIDPVHPALISIGDNVIIGMDSTIVCHERTMAELTLGRVSIGDNCCIGGRVIIRCGVTIGENVVIDMLNSVGQNIEANHMIINSTLVPIPGKEDA